MYRDQVCFTDTGRYGCGPDDEDDVYTVEEFIDLCCSRAFVDCDGFGYPVKDSLSDPDVIVRPSGLSAIPDDATHVVWFNK